MWVCVCCLCVAELKEAFLSLSCKIQCLLYQIKPSAIRCFTDMVALQSVNLLSGPSSDCMQTVNNALPPGFLRSFSPPPKLWNSGSFLSTFWPSYISTQVVQPLEPMLCWWFVPWIDKISGLPHSSFQSHTISQLFQVHLLQTCRLASFLK